MERFTTCKVELDLFDTTAVEDSKLSVDNVQPFADIENIKQENKIQKIATLEDNYWLLDGSFQPADEVVVTQATEQKQNMGYMSEKFNSTIIVGFTKNHTSVGLTFHFWEALPEEIYIKFKQGESFVAEQTFYPVESDCDIYTYESYATKTYDQYLPVSLPDLLGVGSKEFKSTYTEYKYFADIGAIDYDNLEIQLKSSKRFIRINYIEYGIKLLYGESVSKKLKTCTITEEIDAISTELSVNQSNVEIIDMENLFKITNPESYYQYIQQRQLFKITEIIDDEEVFIANHYLKEWNQSKEHSATFTLQDILGLMSETTFYGGIYNDVNAGDLFKEVFDDYGFDDYEIDTKVSSQVISGYLKTMSHREAIQQIAFACGACVTTSRITGIRIFKPAYETIGYIDKGRKLISKASEVTQEDLVTAVNMASHSYILASDSKELYKGEFVAGTYRVTFSKPCANLSITGGAILKSNPNYADVLVTEAGQVVITGNEYEDHIVTYKCQPEESLPSATNENIISITDATLISRRNAMTIAKLVYNIKQYRLKHELKIITTDEEASNMYSIKVNDSYAPVLITKMETDLTGGFLSDVEGIGYALKEVDYYKTGTELYTGEEGII